MKIFNKNARKYMELKISEENNLGHFSEISAGPKFKLSKIFGFQWMTLKLRFAHSTDLFRHGSAAVSLGSAYIRATFPGSS